MGNQDPPTWLIDEVSRLASEKIVVIGGQQVLPDHVINKLTGNKPFTRLAGNNRYETAVEISKYLYPEEKPQDVYLARGDTYVDAVAAGMASRNVLLLVPRCGPIPSVVKAEVQRLRPENVIALGGEAAICNQVLEELTRDQGSGGHGIANPRTAYLWQSTSQLLRLALEVPDSNNVYWVWYHTDACSLLGYLSSDECDSDTESQAVWSLTEEISVDGGATACWTRRSENDWGQERVVDVAYLPSRAVGIYRIMYATRSWFDPCGSASPSSTPFPTTVRATFVNHVAGTEEVSPWITINPVDF